MSKRLTLVFALIFAIFAAGGAAFAQDPRTPFSLKTKSYTPYEGTYKFIFTVGSTASVPERAQGRLVVLNVYDTRQPKTLPITPFDIPANGASSIEVVWPDPPRFGQVRALLVVNDGVRPSLVESFGFWIVPWKLGGLAAALALVLILVLAGVPRTLRYLRDRVPSGMIAYVVEFDDTVMTLSSRFDVSWQDIVRANRLKPPYELQPGSRIFLPKHPLRKPPAPPERKP